MDEIDRQVLVGQVDTSAFALKSEIEEELNFKLKLAETYLCDECPQVVADKSIYLAMQKFSYVRTTLSTSSLLLWTSTSTNSLSQFFQLNRVLEKVDLLLSLPICCYR